MAVIVESQEAAKWIVATLTADPTLSATFWTGTAAKVYNRVAPPGTTGKYIVFQLQAGPRDLYAAGRSAGGSSNFRVASELVYVVKVVMQTEDFGDIEGDYQAVDNLLSNATGSTAVARIDSMRAGAFELVETDGPNQEWRHLGGVYRLIVTSL